MEIQKKIHYSIFSIGSIGCILIFLLVRWVYPPGADILLAILIIIHAIPFFASLIPGLPFLVFFDISDKIYWYTVAVFFAVFSFVWWWFVGRQISILYQKKMSKQSVKASDNWDDD